MTKAGAASFVATAAAIASTFVVLTAGSGCRSKRHVSESESASAGPVAADGSVIITEEARAYARSVFALRCAACHGAMGTGERAAGAAVPNFRDAAWQNGITDAAIERIIAEGGRKVGKNPVMPANPDLATSPESLAAMRAHVRAFGAR